MRDILQLRSREKALTEAPLDDNTTAQIRQFLQDATAIDTSFEQRINSECCSNADFLRDMSYRTVTPPIISNSSSDAWTPGSIFIFDSASAGVLSNRLRSLRLMVLGSLVRTAIHLETHSHPSADPAPERLWAESRVRQLVDDTCSSHAWAFGYATDVTAMKPDGGQSSSEPDGNQLSSELIKGGGGAGGGGGEGNNSFYGTITPDCNSLAWDVIWTFQMACAFQCVPAPQREWMEGQIGGYRRRYDIRA